MVDMKIRESKLMEQIKEAKSLAHVVKEPTSEQKEIIEKQVKRQMRKEKKKKKKW